jgi:hypothetical protein
MFISSEDINCISAVTWTAQKLTLIVIFVEFVLKLQQKRGSQIFYGHVLLILTNDNYRGTGFSRIKQC